MNTFHFMTFDLDRPCCSAEGVDIMVFKPAFCFCPESWAEIGRHMRDLRWFMAVFRHNGLYCMLALAVCCQAMANLCKIWAVFHLTGLC